MKQIDNNTIEPAEVRKQLENYFRKSKAGTETASSVFSKFWKSYNFDFNFQTILSIPTVFDAMIEYLTSIQNGKFTRYEFLSFYVDKCISDSDKEKLGEVALYMELRNKTSVTQKEFVEIISHSNITDFNYENMAASSLVTVRQEGDVALVSFSNNMFLEYLVVYILIRQNKTLEMIKELTIFSKDGLLSIRPNWYPELSLMMDTELRGELIVWLLELGNANNDIIDDGFTDILTSVDANKIDVHTKHEIFELIYTTYKKREVWFPRWSRESLAKFCTTETLKLFKDDIACTKGMSNDYVIKGNIVELIGNILETKSVVLVESEKAYWKLRLIEFANDTNKNGVLQRNALSALENYHDPTIIKAVSGCFESTDNLIQQAFITFCYKTDPNDELTIKYLAEATKIDLIIDAHYGIGQIYTYKGISNFLDCLIDDKIFLQQFISKDTRSYRKESTSTFISKLKSKMDTELLRKIEKMLFLSFIDVHVYQAERSIFIQEAAKIVQNKNSEYITQLVGVVRRVSDKEVTLIQFAELFGLLLNENNYSGFVDSINSGKEEEFIKQRVLSWALLERRKTNRALGMRLYHRAVGDHSIEPIPVQKKPSSRQEAKKILLEFRTLMEPEPNKFSHNVFKFYITNEEMLRSEISKDDLKRLKKLVINEVLRHDTQKFTFKYIDRASGQFSWSTINHYYGDALKTAKLVLSEDEINQYRTNIINYIPFAFNDDLDSIYDLVPRVDNNDLVYLNKLYLSTQELKYFSPSTYSYAIKHYVEQGCLLNSSIIVLRALINDKTLESYARMAAIDAYKTVLSADDISEIGIIKKQILDIGAENDELTSALNEILITVFKDDEAIKWRLNEIKKRVSPFKEDSVQGFHTVSRIEDEIYGRNFAKPLINLDSPRYITDFINLLDFSLTLSPGADSKSYGPYIQYMWNIAIEYVEKQSKEGSIEPFTALKNWVDSHDDIEGVNWLNSRLDTLKNSYVLQSTVVSSVEEFMRFMERYRG